MGDQDWRSYPQLNLFTVQKGSQYVTTCMYYYVLGHVFGEPEIINERLEPGIW